MKKSKSRRDFLKVLAASTVALGASSAANLTKTEGENRPVKIGFLLPRSRYYSQFGEQLRLGFDTYLRSRANVLGFKSVETYFEDIGTGPYLGYKKAAKLLEVNGVDLLVGAVGSETVAALSPLLAARKRLLVVANFGANIVRKDERSPFVFYNTLNHWQTSYEVGKWAAESFGPKAMAITSLYDSGYDHLYAFETGVTDAEGIVATHLTDNNSVEHDLPATTARIEEVRPDFIYLLHSDPIAGVLTSQLKQMSLGIPIVTSEALMHLSTQTGQLNTNVQSGLRWSAKLENQENQMFKALFAKQNHRSADVFAMLGYETAQLLDKALERSEGRTSPAVLSRALKGLEFFGPRGQIRLDPKAQSTLSPIYFQKAESLVGEEPQRLTSLKAIYREQRTGWTHDYLCV